jgi:hypothetical protein
MRRFTIAPEPGRASTGRAAPDERRALERRDGDPVTFDRDETRHLARVLRLRPGDTIVASDGSGQPAICISICHVPPGNPAAAKNKIIPLQALRAHLNHGAASHEETDYLGACDNTESDSSSSAPTDSSSTASQDPNSTATSTGDNAITSGSTSTSADPGLTGGTTQPTDPTQTTSTPDTQPTDSSQTSSSPTSSDSTIPLWCQAYVGIDNNCDGFDDLTGDPLL